MVLKGNHRSYRILDRSGRNKNMNMNMKSAAVAEKLYSEACEVPNGLIGKE